MLDPQAALGRQQALREGISRSAICNHEHEIGIAQTLKAYAYQKAWHNKVPAMQGLTALLNGHTAGHCHKTIVYSHTASLTISARCAGKECNMLKVTGLCLVHPPSQVSRKPDPAGCLIRFTHMKCFVGEA